MITNINEFRKFINESRVRGNTRSDIEALLEDLTDEQFVKDLCIDEHDVDYNIDTYTRPDGRGDDMTVFDLEINNPKPEAIAAIHNPEELAKLIAPLKEWAKKHDFYVEMAQMTTDVDDKIIFISLTEYVADDEDKWARNED